MKRFTGIVLGGVLVIFLSMSLSFAADKLAYVNLSKAFSEYTKTKDYDKILTEKENAYTAERDKKANDLKQLRDKINLLSDKEKETKQADFQEKVKAFQEFVSQKEGDLRKEQDERMREIMQDIQGVVKTISERDGYTLVFNDRVLVYQQKSLDITDQVVTALNKQKK
ncbi:MAG: OmpH family outer membrane protein [Candidatus Omnitrophota bacterium]|jgi:outer membrane protein